MRRALFTIIFAAAALTAAPLQAQKQGQIFLSLTTPEGKPVEGLTADDVVVQEDGMPCKTVKVETIAWPTKLQVLVDNGRVNTDPINPLQNGLKEFFAQIPDGVEMSIYTTAGSPRPVVKPTTDRKKVIDAIPLIAPDSGSGQFFDALLEASERVDKDKTPSHNIIVMVGTDGGTMRTLDRDFQKLQMNVFNHGITTHVLLNIKGQGAGGPIDLGLNITKFTGGKYESFNGTTRLASVLPEIGKLVAKSVALQSQEYRVTYERPAKPNEKGGSINAQVRKEGVVKLSLHGNQVP
jgi:hypothetical protein